MHEYLSLPSVLAIGGSFMIPENLVNDENWEELSKLSRQAVKTMLDFKLTHLGINHENEEQSKQTAQTLCDLFNFTFYNKPKSKFAGVGFELQIVKVVELMDILEFTLHILNVHCII